MRVTGGKGEGRRTLRIELEGEDECSPVQDPSALTRIDAYVPVSQEQVAPMLSRLESDTLLLPCRFSLNGAERPRFNPRAPGAFFRAGGVRGWVGLPAWLGRPTQLRLFYLGVAAGTRELQLPAGAVEIWLNDDRARTDLSGFVGTSSRYKRLLRLVELEAQRFVRKTIAGHAARMRRAWAILREDSLARDAWRRRQDWGASGEPDRLALSETLSAALSGGDPRRARLRRLLWTAHATLWLRDLVRDHVVTRSRAAPGLWPALSAAPIFFGNDGSLWSYERLRARSDRSTVRRLAPAGRAVDHTAAPLWCPTHRDYAWLKSTLWAG
ncbi:MAG: hypothetical protein HY553_10660 [Elusimicrobia bacterium]|nr:hypothetical protein [Elusimicrobiota bacterium]